MKAGNLLFSAVQFFFAVGIILLGGFFIGLQDAAHLRSVLARFLTSEGVPFSLIGFAILGLGIALLAGFFMMHRGQYYTVRMKGGSCEIDPAVIRSYLSDYWKKKFPKENLSVEVLVAKDQKLELFVELPLISPEMHQAILEKAEGDLSALLQKHIGYRKPFDLSVLIK
jgi:hypothetical protein